VDASETIPNVLKRRSAVIVPSSRPAAPAGSITSPVAGAESRHALSSGVALSIPQDQLAPIIPANDLPPRRTLAIAYSAIVGSRAYGLDQDDSDVDRRGFYIPSADLHFSLCGVPEQLVHDDDQLCYWEIEKFLHLALKANPTVLETLFSPAVEIATSRAHELLAERHRFLSRRAYQTFLGYADTQFNKMQRAHERAGSADGIKWRHAMHLIRLLHAGIHLVRSGTLNLRVPEELRPTLLSIRRGERPWQEVAALHARLCREFDEAFSRTPLREEPDTAFADNYLVSLRLAVAGAAS
jgi:hypothetical protein